MIPTSAINDSQPICAGAMCSGRRSARFRRRRMSAAIVATATVTLFGMGTAASAAIVPTIQLATSANYAVLAGTTVTNIGNSVLDNSLGLWPGSSITGFPPGLVLAPGTTDTTNAVAQQAQSDLTAAYVDAAARPVDATITSELENLQLTPGVYSGPSKSALLLSGPLVLDGQGDVNAVFIFQTDSTLITATASTISLINGAQECNVFWQVGSSATLGTGSVFTGTILALTSIAVGAGVTIHGRALARNGEVTLDTDSFTKPTCAQAAPPTTTTTPPPTTVSGTGTLPSTGRSTRTTSGLALVALIAGTSALIMSRRKMTP